MKLKIFVAAFTLTYAAGCTELSEPNGDTSLRLSADASSNGSSRLIARLVVQNNGASAEFVTFGSCPFDPVAVRIYAQPTHAGLPVWENTRAFTGGCTGAEQVREVPAHSEVTFRYEIETVKILGDSLRPETYHVTVAPRFTTPELRWPEIPAGAVNLR